MVADIRLLQGKKVEDPDLRSKNITQLIQELAFEILTEEELALATPEKKESHERS